MLATSAIRDARTAGIPTDSFSLVGSLRRYAPAVGNVSLLAVAPQDRHSSVLSGFEALPVVSEVLERTTSSSTVATARGALTLHVATPEDEGAALVWHTGSRSHTSQLRERAARRGFRFAEGRLVHDAGGQAACPSEHDFYRLLGLPYIPPELREGEEEIAIAERGALPHLVSHADIRGDLHMHTTWSDGRDSIESMVVASRHLGYEYVAITDHSERSWASRRLTAADIPRQRAAIEALRSRIPGVQILHGVEVDIMFDGTLDFGDDLLSGFDIVLASLHDHAGHDSRGLTERYLRAIAHPLVNVITHPTNRSPAHSPGYDLDFDRLFAAAADSGTALEIDGAPGHLDMDGAIARRAADAGVTIVIDSDCHRADALGQQMTFGIGTARRGWIEPRHVLNAGGVDAVRDFVARKRARR